MTQSLKPHVKNETDLDALRKQAADDGLVTLRLSGAKKVSDGLTTMDEVLRVTPFTF